jgi:hypothetical protein
MLLTGCGAHQEAAAPPATDAAMTGAADIARSDAPTAAQEPASAQTARKYLAEHQYWVFELPETEIAKRWNAHLALCMDDCEVLNASISTSAHSPVYATLQLRVARGAAHKFFAAMESADIVERRVVREDKTLQVVDIEARLKNLTEMRDRLRVLQTQYKGSLKDLLETGKELARVQSELDSMFAQRKVLANETEKILLNADYRAQPGLGETGSLQPLREAWRKVGNTFAGSLGSALLFIVAALPWVGIVLPVAWGTWKGSKVAWRAIQARLGRKAA